MTEKEFIKLIQPRIEAYCKKKGIKFEDLHTLVCYYQPFDDMHGNPIEFKGREWIFNVSPSPFDEERTPEEKQEYLANCSVYNILDQDDDGERVFKKDMIIEAGDVLK